jgi:hypothetical protein
MKLLILIVAALLLTATGFTQSKGITISCKVTSFEESLPLEGAGILAKGCKTETGTQADGSFTLIIYPDEKTLQVSLEGYETKEIAITKAREYNIVLKRANTFVKNAKPGLKQI